MHIYVDACTAMLYCSITFQKSITVARITEVPLVAYLPKCIVQSRVLRPFRFQTGGTVLVGIHHAQLSHYVDFPRILGSIQPYPIFIQICFIRKNGDKLHNIFSCVHQTSMKSNDKAIVVESRYI